MKAGPVLGWPSFFGMVCYCSFFIVDKNRIGKGEEKQTMKTLQVRIEGRVQGVCFRDYTRRQARAEGLTGWVRNCADGSVEALITGPERALERMLLWFQEGSPHSLVTAVKVHAINPPREFPDFQITY